MSTVLPSDVKIGDAVNGRDYGNNRFREVGCHRKMKQSGKAVGSERLLPR